MLQESCKKELTNTNGCFMLLKAEHLFLDEKENFMEKDEKLKALDAALSHIESSTAKEL